MILQHRSGNGTGALGVSCFCSSFPVREVAFWLIKPKVFFLSNPNPCFSVFFLFFSSSASSSSSELRECTYWKRCDSAQEPLPLRGEEYIQRDTVPYKEILYVDGNNEEEEEKIKKGHTHTHTHTETLVPKICPNRGSDDSKKI